MIIKTIFSKQAKDMFKNPAVLIQFIIYPVVALVFTELVAKSETFEGMDVNMFVIMMGSIFAGMGLIISTAAIIAEDIESKSLRLLVMAGVRPQQYLLGVGGFLLLAGAFTALLFSLIGVFSTEELFKFLAVMIACTATSIIIGATIGIFSKNQQAATSLGMPIAMVFGFVPMLASFNDTVYQYSSFLYTQQLNIIVNDFSENFSKAMLVILANIFIVGVLFMLAYRKRGLRS